MPPRRCSGCSTPMGATDTYCGVCGRIQMPDAPAGSLGDHPITTRQLLLWGTAIVLVLALLSWAIVRLGG